MLEVYIRINGLYRPHDPPIQFKSCMYSQQCPDGDPCSLYGGRSQRPLSRCRSVLVRCLGASVQVFRYIGRPPRLSAYRYPPTRPSRWTHVAGLLLVLYERRPARRTSPRPWGGSQSRRQSWVDSPSHGEFLGARVPPSGPRGPHRKTPPSQCPYDGGSAPRIHRAGFVHACDLRAMVEGGGSECGRSVWIPAVRRCVVECGSRVRAPRHPEIPPVRAGGRMVHAPPQESQGADRVPAGWGRI
jgi:hypothetical protein